MQNVIFTNKIRSYFNTYCYKSEPSVVTFMTIRQFTLKQLS